MDFKDLYNMISPALRRIAKRHNYCSVSIDEDDLYQEMSIYLWNNYKDGIPSDINDSYVIKGCQYHILNYIRIKKDRAKVMSIERPLDGEGTTLKDVLEVREEPIEDYIDRKITIDEILNNGFTKREKQVFLLLLEGYTTREAGQRLGISHVRVTRLKNNLIHKWQRKKGPAPYQNFSSNV